MQSPKLLLCASTLTNNSAATMCYAASVVSLSFITYDEVLAGTKSRNELIDQAIPENMFRTMSRLPSAPSSEITASKKYQFICVFQKNMSIFVFS